MGVFTERTAIMLKSIQVIASGKIPPRTLPARSKRALALACAAALPIAASAQTSSCGF